MGVGRQGPTGVTLAEAYDPDAMKPKNNLADIHSKSAALANLGVAATAAELNALDGNTATAAELSLNDGLVATATIALAASATTDGMDITITAKDAAGATLAGVHEFVIHASDADTGIGLTADAFSGDLTASTGAILGALTAKKAWVIQTAATGIFVATLVDSANPADIYIALKKPHAAGMVVSAVSGVNWEGV